ncbi:MAG: hypothetical protein NVS4B3_28090 [Gemmatimonadaceae bacterium]
MVEPWLRGPLPGIDRLLMPSAHALTQAAEDIDRAVPPLTPDALWVRPWGAASVGFHLRHVAGSIDRLLTYARGAQLDEAQRVTLAAELAPPIGADSAAALSAQAVRAIDGAIEQLRMTPTDTLFESRLVGKNRLPSSVYALLVHIAEHTQRHVGQIVTTAMIATGSLTEGRKNRQSKRRPR